MTIMKKKDYTNKVRGEKANCARYAFANTLASQGWIEVDEAPNCTN